MAGSTDGDAPLSAELLARVRRDFSESQQQPAADLLLALRRHHVMAGSDFNLDNARGALLELAGGDVAELRRCLAIAKLDFRDVIVMAMDRKAANQRP